MYGFGRSSCLLFKKCQMEGHNPGSVIDLAREE